MLLFYVLLSSRLSFFLSDIFLCLFTFPLSLSIMFSMSCAWSLCLHYFLSPFSVSHSRFFVSAFWFFTSLRPFFSVSLSLSGFWIFMSVFDLISLSLSLQLFMSEWHICLYHTCSFSLVSVPLDHKLK